MIGRDRVAALASAVTPIAALLAVWEILTRSGLVSPQVLPRFSSVGVAAMDLAVPGTLGPCSGYGSDEVVTMVLRGHRIG